MTSAGRYISAFFVVVLVSVLVACGASTAPIAVTMSPGSAKAIDQAQTVGITATVKNDSKNAGVTWSVSGGGTLSNQTPAGATYNTPASVTAAFTATVIATSVSDTTKAASLQITVNPLPAVTTSSLPVATAGTAYPNTTLTMSGGTSPFTWSVSPANLPTGLSLNASTGVISGTPTGGGTGSYTFKLTDATGVSATQALTITVNAPPPLTITTGSLAAGVMGTAYNQTVAATGGVPSYHWAVTSGSLPAGLSLNAASGAITGTPSGTFTGTTTFTVSVTDSQTPTPTTQSAILSISVTAPPLSVTTNSLPGGTLGTAYGNQTLAATGGIAPYTWSISVGSLPAGLSLNASTGVISGTPTGNVTGPVNFTVKVTDAETPTASTATAALSITITAPPLSVTTTSLAVGVVGSAYSATLQATGGVSPYTWQVTTGNLPAGLTLNGSTGVISGSPTTAGTSPITVTVTDSQSPTKKTATANLSITVNPQLAVTTSSLANAVVGTAYNQTLAATGGITPYTWAVTTGSLPAGLTLNAGTGAITGTPTGPQVGTISFTVTVTDSENPAKTASANLGITVSAPPLSVTSLSLPGGTLGTAYTATLTATGGITPYTWSIIGSLPAGLNLNASTGVISGTPTGSVTGPINFTAKVTDSEQPTASATAALSITITAAPLSVVTSSLPVGVDGSAYSATLQAAGGVSPYTWAVTTGSLPAGLSLNGSTGVISGTPTGSGTSFTVTVTDSETQTQTATKNLTITINPQLTVTTTTLAAGVVGTAYNQTLAATGGITPYTWAVTTGSLPAGLILNASTGAITGKPTGPQVGTISFTVTVTDSESPTKTASANLSISISAPTLTITTSSLPTGVLSQNYSAMLAATGGVTPYTWSITAGSLPSGLSLNASTGQITGTPTATGTSSFTVKVADSETPTQQTATANLSITVNNSAPLQITTSGLPNGVVNSPYPNNAYLTATGGIQPYTWSYTGNMPPGLTLTPSTGQISGTPTSTGTFNFVAKVTDSSSPTQSVTANLSITINSALVITTTSVPNGSVGAQYNATVNASGGVQPYSWSITGGSLPPGLSYNNNNNSLNISGTPTTTGSYPFTLQVTDNQGNTTSQGFTISISQGAPLSIQTTAMPGGDKNWPYNASLKAQGGVQPYTWAVISGNLPAGLSISPSGSSNGVISGTPTATGTASFTVQVTDSESPAATATANLSIVIGDCGNDSNLHGNYAFLLNGWKGTTDANSAIGSFSANGAGSITSGLLDVSDQSKGPQSGTITGTYCVSSNNLVLIDLVAGGGLGGGTASFAAALDSTGNGHIIRYDGTSSDISAGLLRKTQTTAFSTGEIKGNYAFGIVGADQNANRFAVAGEFNSNGSGTLGGEADYDSECTGGSCSGNVGNTTLNASNFSVASTGRGTATISFTAAPAPINFVFYVVSSSEMLMMATDNTESPSMIIAGQVLEQSASLTDASLKGNSVLEVQGLDTSSGSPVSDIQAGLINASGNGTFSVSIDENDGGTFDNGTGNPTTISGDYAVASSGRVTLSNLSGGGGNNHPPVFYLVGTNQAFVVGTDNSVTFGMIEPQTGSNFTNASLNGNYLGGSQPPVDWNGGIEVDQVHADGAGNFTGMSDRNNSGCGSGGGGSCPNASSITATYSVSSSGRTTVSQGGQVGGIIYIISSTQVVFLSTQDSNATLQDFHQ